MHVSGILDSNQERVCKDQGITPEPDRVLCLQETNTVVIRDAVQNAAASYSFNSSKGLKNLATFLGFSCAFFIVDIEHKISFLKQKKIIPQIFSNIMNPEIMTSCFHTSAEVTSTDKG